DPGAGQPVSSDDREVVIDPDGVLAAVGADLSDLVGQDGVLQARPVHIDHPLRKEGHGREFSDSGCDADPDMPDLTVGTVIHHRLDGDPVGPPHTGCLYAPRHAPSPFQEIPTPLGYIQVETQEPPPERGFLTRIRVSSGTPSRWPVRSGR